jgi:hypothetical protein
VVGISYFNSPEILFAIKYKVNFQTSSGPPEKDFCIGTPVSYPCSWSNNYQEKSFLSMWIFLFPAGQIGKNSDLVVLENG